MKTCIAAFSGKPQGNNSSEANSGQEAPISWDVGNYFGRSASKHTKTWLACPLDLALFAVLTRLGGHNTTRAKIMKTGKTKQIVSSVRHKMWPTRWLSADRSVHNSDNEYHGRIELYSHADTTVLGCNYVIITYKGKEYEVSPYSGEYDSIKYVPVVTRATA